MGRVLLSSVVLLCGLQRSSAWCGPPPVQRAHRHSALVMRRDDGYYVNGAVPSPERNQGGERVVRRKGRAVAASGETEGSSRRTLLLGVFGAGCWYTAINVVSQRNKPVVTAPLIDDGDAVTAPALELELQDLLAVPNFPDEEVKALVLRLEQTGGPTLAASAPQGRWVLPWVGGWERVWAAQQDSSLFGGPPRTSLGSRAGLKLESARQFVYGPGEGGITLEYLYSPPGSPGKEAGAQGNSVLLARQGAVSNLGGNFFELDFSTPLQGYEVERSKGSDLLTPLPSIPPSEGAPPVRGLTMQTTYLSAALWILRSYTNPDQVVVFERTETRSVLDRRGLVAEGQLKPPDDESIRYGRLLFGETLSDYAGWSDAASKDAEQKRKLLER